MKSPLPIFERHVPTVLVSEKQSEPEMIKRPTGALDGEIESCLSRVLSDNEHRLRTARSTAYHSKWLSFKCERRYFPPLAKGVEAGAGGGRARRLPDDQ